MSDDTFQSAVAAKVNGTRDTLDCTLQEALVYVASETKHSFDTVQSWYLGRVLEPASDDLALVKAYFDYRPSERVFVDHWTRIVAGWSLSDRTDPRCANVNSYDSFIAMLQEVFADFKSNSGRVMGFASSKLAQWIDKINPKNKFAMNDEMMLLVIEYLPLLFAIVDGDVVCEYSPPWVLWGEFKKYTEENGITMKSAADAVGLQSEMVRMGFSKIASGDAPTYFKDRAAPIKLVKYLSRKIEKRVIFAGEHGEIPLAAWMKYKSEIPSSTPPVILDRKIASSTELQLQSVELPTQLAPEGVILKAFEKAMEVLKMPRETDLIVRTPEVIATINALFSVRNILNLSLVIFSDDLGIRRRTCQRLNNEESKISGLVWIRIMRYVEAYLKSECQDIVGRHNDAKITLTEADDAVSEEIEPKNNESVDVVKVEIKHEKAVPVVENPLVALVRELRDMFGSHAKNVAQLFEQQLPAIEAYTQTQSIAQIPVSDDLPKIEKADFTQVGISSELIENVLRNGKTFLQALNALVGAIDPEDSGSRKRMSDQLSELFNELTNTLELYGRHVPFDGLDVLRMSRSFQKKNLSKTKGGE